MIHTAEGIKDDDVDPLQNSTRLGNTSRLPIGGCPLGVDSNSPNTTSVHLISPKVKPSLQQFHVSLYVTHSLQVPLY